MKHFIYSDTEILNSYLSQINDGLIKNVRSEVMDQTTSSKKESIKDPNHSTEFGVNIPFVNLKINGSNSTYESTTALSQLDSGKELINKIFHDNAFNQFTNYLKKENLLKNINECVLGDYVKLTSTYEIWDFDYLTDIFDDDFIDFLSDSSTNLYFQESNVNNTKISNSAFKNKKREFMEIHNQTAKIFKLCKKVIPYTKFITLQNCFIPLNEKFLRSSIKDIRFKYTGEISLIGKYTNNYNNTNYSTCNGGFSEMFQEIDNVINHFFNDMLNIDNNIKILTPIALYFE